MICAWTSVLLWRTVPNFPCLTFGGHSKGICREFLKILGSFANFRLHSASESIGLQRNSLRNGAGNFWTPSREFSTKSREFAGNFANADESVMEGPMTLVRRAPVSA